METTEEEEFEYTRYEVEQKFLIRTRQDLNIVCLGTPRSEHEGIGAGRREIRKFSDNDNDGDKSPPIQNRRSIRLDRIVAIAWRAKLTGKKKTSGRDRIYDAAGRRSQFVRFAVTREINR